jgi:hypothetical protein
VIEEDSSLEIILALLPFISHTNNSETSKKKERQKPVKGSGGKKELGRAGGPQRGVYNPLTFCG